MRDGMASSNATKPSFFALCSGINELVCKDDGIYDGQRLGCWRQTQWEFEFVHFRLLQSGLAAKNSRPLLPARSNFEDRRVG
jgi:hypothetical protein